MTIQEAKKIGKGSLTFSPTPELDVSVLLQCITGFDKTKLLLNRDYILSSDQESLFNDFISMRKTGLPIAYITGTKEFFGNDFYVTKDVLIPKSDTELLVELSIDFIKNKFFDNLKNKEKIYICDMCSGSGCVGISIANALNDFLLDVTFVDISEESLKIAQKNASKILKSRSNLNISFVKSNLFNDVKNKTFNLIATNPPYVPHQEAIALLKDGRNEPLLALDGDVDENNIICSSNDGLAIIKRLVPQCFKHLSFNGKLIMETGEYNALQTAELFNKSGFNNVHIEKDLNGMLRDVIGVKC